MEEKTPLSHEAVCFQMLDFGTSKHNSEVSKSNSNILVEIYFFRQESFYASNYFERLPIVSSAFKVS